MNDNFNYECNYDQLTMKVRVICFFFFLSLFSRDIHILAREIIS